ncbi:protein MODIFIER OF SNC1 1-like isoform X2 [Actinidia eriantha]|uniref:protein MODIFIER OF SNC1 1-like isoform X2 n=1 Tax=Actinidia eriantha TaxID=165200 RepID=UPI00258D194F|nr:protein MODIFIER OF SNC1 1-like isoform X2 [Actinidia eriantha]
MMRRLSRNRGQVPGNNSCSRRWKSTTRDHGSNGRPGSSSGRAASGKEECNFFSWSGTANSWRRNGSQRFEDGVPYLNANVPPQHFDAWHGPPINPPPDVWYRGPPGCPPYGTPIAPNGFPTEPSPYYHPQIPPTTLANSQPVPPPETAPRGHHPKNGDLYISHIPNA